MEGNPAILTAAIYAIGVKSILYSANVSRMAHPKPQLIEVHHKNYKLKTMTGADLTGLVSLCRECHLAIEFDEKGKKRELAAANNALALRIQKASGSA